MEVRHVTIHGHAVGFRMAGCGPVILLIHGMAGSSRTWLEVMRLLARDYTVIAPDLLGHGDSAKPIADYSLGAYASGLRDLLVGALGIESATLVGQSLGGGVAMQLAYQHPELCERLVLVGSGGLGREVSPVLRAMALPGAEYLMPVLFPRFARRAGERVITFFRDRGVRVRDRDDVVAVAPHDQRGDSLGEVEAVACAHGLPARVDHRAHGADEGVAVGRLGERRVGAPNLGDVRRPHAAIAEERDHPLADAAREAREQHRHQVLRAGQRHRAQHRAHLAAEPAAAD